jgi:asparagine synthetase B (glutamine-hydrolysing)
VRTERFHSPAVVPQHSGTALNVASHADAIEETPLGSVEARLRGLLTEAVKKRMIGHRRIGCMLSGGLDSSLITSLVHRLISRTTKF